MKVKKSITLSEDLLHSINERFGKQRNLSRFIENAIRDLLSDRSERKETSRILRYSIKGQRNSIERQKMSYPIRPTYEARRTLSEI
jgi:metal-responsive CopG/Arc/MetJ family transcriptional regulator